MVGMAMSNAPAAMAPWNGKDRLLGTNPIAVSFPIPGSNPIIFDMASSKVAKSRLKPYLDQGQPIPEGWATDSDGIPTTDPLKAINGLMLPAGDHKGAGLAMMIDLVAGLLSGAAFLDNVGRFYSHDNASMNVGFTMVAMDPLLVMGSRYPATIQQYRSRVIESRPLDPDVPVRMPGSLSLEQLRMSEKEGLQLDASIIENLDGMLLSSGIHYNFRESLK